MVTMFMKNLTLKKYNKQIFNQLYKKYEHFQLGFFNDNTLLFIGQNPGRTFNTQTTIETKVVSDKQSFEEFEKSYEELIKNSKIGNFIAKIINNKWEKISLTNIVKIATEDNQIPTDGMIQTFFPITQKQIELLQPKLIICLGKFAGKQFGINEFYNIQRYKNSFITMFYHPSYLMRKGLLSEIDIMNKFINNTLKKCN